MVDPPRLGPEDLVLCSGTLLGAGFAKLVEAAEAGGFRGITVWPQDYRAAREAGRGNRDLESLRSLPGARVGCVQINDAPLDPQGDAILETVEARWLPGQGAIPLVELVRTLDQIGSRAPIGVEVFSRELRALPPLEVGRRCGDAARSILAAARPVVGPAAG